MSPIVAVEGSAAVADKRVIELSRRTRTVETLFNTTTAKFNMKRFIVRIAVVFSGPTEFSDRTTTWVTCHYSNVC